MPSLNQKTATLGIPFMGSRPSRAKTPAEAQSEVQSILLQAAKNPAVSRDFLCTIATGLSEQPNAPSDFKDVILSATLQLFDKDSESNPLARSLNLQKFRLSSDNGDTANALILLKQRHLPTDYCTLTAPAPRFVSSNIRSEDYPADVIYTSMVGVTSTEFDLDATGQAINGRLLVSDPPYIFDDVTRSGISTIRYNPPRQNGKLMPCRGYVQSVRWQLPY